MRAIKSWPWVLLCCLVVSDFTADASRDGRARTDRSTGHGGDGAHVIHPDSKAAPHRRSNYLDTPMGPKEDMYKVLGRLPALTHVFGGKHSIPDVDALEDFRSDDKRSWNAPPLLRYIYRKKPYRGFGKRQSDITEDENSRITIIAKSNTILRSDNTQELKSRDAPKQDAPLDDTTDSEEEIRSLSLPDDQDEELKSLSDGSGEKRSWGGAPWRWNKSNKFGATRTSGKRSWGGTPLRWYTYRDTQDDKIGAENKRSWGGHPIAWGKHIASSAENEGVNRYKRSWGSNPLWLKDFHGGSGSGGDKRSWGAAPVSWSKYGNGGDTTANKRSWGSAPIAWNIKYTTENNDNEPGNKRSWGSEPFRWNSHKSGGDDTSKSGGKRSWGGAPMRWRSYHSNGGSDGVTGSGSKRSWGSAPRSWRKLSIKQLLGKRQESQRSLEKLFDLDPPAGLSAEGPRE